MYYSKNNFAKMGGAFIATLLTAPFVLAAKLARAIYKSINTKKEVAQCK